MPATNLNDFTFPEQDINIKCVCGETFGFPNIVVVAKREEMTRFGPKKLELMHATCECGLANIFLFEHLGDTTSVQGMRTDLHLGEITKFMGSEPIGDKHVLAIQWSLWHNDLIDRVFFDLG